MNFSFLIPQITANNDGHKSTQSHTFSKHRQQHEPKSAQTPRALSILKARSSRPPLPETASGISARSNASVVPHRVSSPHKPSFSHRTTDGLLVPEPCLLPLLVLLRRHHRSIDRDMPRTVGASPKSPWTSLARVCTSVTVTGTAS